MHKGWQKKQTGFTIVELLIVIVVIAILAAISVAAYTGVQDRAHTAAVASDLSNLSKKFEMFHVDNGRYPNKVAEMNAMGMTIAKNSYMTNSVMGANLVPCISESLMGNPNPQEYVISAVTVTNKRLYVTKGGVVQEYTGPGSWSSTDANYVSMCQNINSNTGVMGGSAGWTPGTSWRPWTGG